MMEIILFWLLLSIAIAVWAGNKGRSGLGWFLLSIIISPLLAAVLLAVSSDRRAQAQQLAREVPSPATHVKCPDCAELVKKEARVCRYCGCKLTPVLDSPESTQDKNLIAKQIAVIIMVIAVGYVVYLAR